MTLTELETMNRLKEENIRLKQENERLRTRYAGMLCVALASFYATEQAKTALALTKELVSRAVA